MKVTAQIDVTSTEYFNHLCDVMIKDIKKQTDKNVAMSELIEGYTYERNISYQKKDTHIKISIGPLIKDKYFFVKYESSDTSGQYYYDFSNSDGKHYVTYFEETYYKKETVGTYFGNLLKRIKEKAIVQKALRNIELTTAYIKNQKGR